MNVSSPEFDVKDIGLVESPLADPAGSPAGSENPKAGVAEAFEHALPVSETHLPPHETDRG